MQRKFAIQKFFGISGISPQIPADLERVTHKENGLTAEDDLSLLLALPQLAVLLLQGRDVHGQALAVHVLLRGTKRRRILEILFCLALLKLFCRRFFFLLSVLVSRTSLMELLKKLLLATSGIC